METQWKCPFFVQCLKYGTQKEKCIFVQHSGRYRFAKLEDVWGEDMARFFAREARYWNENHTFCFSKEFATFQMSQLLFQLQNWARKSGMKLFQVFRQNSTSTWNRAENGNKRKKKQQKKALLKKQEIKKLSDQNIFFETTLHHA